MLVHDRPERHGRGGRRSWPRKRSRPELNLGCGRPVGQRGVWARGVIVPAPALDDDLGFLERIEDLAVEQLVPEPTSVTPIDRIASATVRPCAVSTSTWRSFATISSGLCRFLDIDPSSFGSREPYLREDHFSGSLRSLVDHAVRRKRRRRRSSLARPYMLRFRSLRRLICPSACPLLHGRLRAARTAQPS